MAQEHHVHAVDLVARVVKVVVALVRRIQIAVDQHILKDREVTIQAVQAVVHHAQDVRKVIIVVLIDLEVIALAAREVIAVDPAVAQEAVARVQDQHLNKNLSTEYFQ